MSIWLLKAAVQGVLSLMPGREWWNSLLQRYGSRRLDMSRARFEQKLLQCRRHLEGWRSAGARPETPAAVLELGTGWHPVIPIGMCLCGASVVWTIDIVALLTPAGTRRTLGLFAEYAEDGRLARLLPEARPERVEALRAALAADPRTGAGPEVLKRMGVAPLVCDARRAAIPAGSIDLFISNCVLEHIEPATIGGILRAFRRLAAPGAVMSHIIDLSDHYANWDRSITPYNFLKYSDRAWRWLNNPLNYQNRLRVSDFRRIHGAAGFRILHEHKIQGPDGALDGIRLARKFQRYPRDELLTTCVRMVSVVGQGTPRV